MFEIQGGTGLRNLPGSLSHRTLSVLLFWFQQAIVGSSAQCTVCLNQVSREDLYDLACGHMFCGECWDAYCQVQIKQGTTLGMFFLLFFISLLIMTSRKLWVVCRRNVKKNKFKDDKFLMKRLAANILCQKCQQPKWS